MGFWDDVEGAVGGGLTGFAVGGPVGAIAGAGLGAYSAYQAGEAQDKQKQMLQDYYNSVNGRQAPQTGYSDFRANQSDLINRLDALSRGQGPSLAAQQFQQATDRNVATQQAVANSGRGGNLAAMTAANNMQMLGAQAAQGSAIARTGEEMGALQQLGGVIGQARGQDESINVANMEAKLRAMGYNDSAIQAILQMKMQQAMQPTAGDRILAGGAGAYAMGATQKGQQASGGGASGGLGQGSAYNAFGNSILNPGNWSGNGPNWGAGGQFGWTPGHG